MKMMELRDNLARMRCIDRDDLPPGLFWDEDWPSFRDNPWRYFLGCSDQHRLDIWNALEADRARSVEDHAKRLLDTLDKVLG